MTPHIGFTIRIGTQEYCLAACVERARGDGRPGVLMTWSTQCPDCSASFSVTTGATFKDVRRRYDACRKPGKPILRTARRPGIGAGIGAELAQNWRSGRVPRGGMRQFPPKSLDLGGNWRILSPAPRNELARELAQNWRR